MDVDQTAGPSSNPLAYLEHEEASAPAALKSFWTRIRTAYEKKSVQSLAGCKPNIRLSSLKCMPLTWRRLWHNMTVAIMDFVSEEESGPYQIELFDK